MRFSCEGMRRPGGRIAIAGLLTATALLLYIASDPGLAQSDRSAAPQPTAPAPTELERIYERLDAIGAAVMGLLRRVEGIEQRLRAAPGAAGRGGAEPPATPPAAAAPAPRAAPSAAPSAPPVPQPRRAAQPDGPAAEPAPSAGPAVPPNSQPGEFEVDGEAIDRALERTLIQAGVLLLPFGQAEIQPTFSYTRREFDAPVRTVQNGAVFIGERRIRRDVFEGSLALRVGLPLDSQAELLFPYRHVDQSTLNTSGFVPLNEDDDSGSGLGDISIGIAKTLLRESSWWPDVVARLRWNTGTGEKFDNDVALGGGFQALGGAVSLVKRVDPLAFTASFGYQTFFESDDIDPGDNFSTSVGTVLATSPGTSLRFVLDADFRDDTRVDGESISGSDDVEANLTIGGSTVLGRGVFFDLAGSIGLTDASPDFAIRAALPIRFNLPFL